jgi:DNA replication protein DnaC
MEEVKYKAEDWPQYAHDFARADAEEINCETCSGKLEECRNSQRGFRTVIIEGYPRKYPAVGIRPCKSMHIEMERRRIGARMEAAGVGERFWNRRFESFDQGADQAAYDAAWKYALEQSMKKWIVFLGSPGTGKTHLATAIIIWRIEHEWRPLAIRAKDAIYQLHASYQDNTTDKFLRELKGAQLLMLDDIGEENDQKDKEFITAVIKARYESDRPTILTTNLDGETLGKRYGDAVFSRLEEVAAVVNMTGEDYRRRLA